MTVTKIDPVDLSLLQREMNKSLMVAWINADLLNRASCDVRKSVVLYDADKDFVHAIHDEPDEALCQRLFDNTTVRFWSKGAV